LWLVGPVVSCEVMAATDNPYRPDRGAPAATDNDTDRWVTIPDAARLLGVTERTIRRQIAQGKLSSRHDEGGRTLVRVTVTDATDVTGDAASDVPVTNVSDTPVTTVTPTPDAGELSRLRAEVERLRIEVEALRVELATARAEAREWRARAEERQAAIDRLEADKERAEEDRRNAWAALATTLAKIPQLEAKSGEPARPWWKFWG